MKKIFIHTPGASDANSFWRCMGPLSYLAKHSQGEIQIHRPTDGITLHWDSLDQYDLIFMHRPCGPQDLTLLQMAKLLNIPVWCDYDDWLFHLPDWNPHRNLYHQTGLQHIIGTMIACCDIVSVSTTALLHAFQKVSDRVVLLPNAYRSDLFPYRNLPFEKREDIYVWRGTHTHDGDVLPMLPAFKGLQKKIHFLGGSPYALTSQLSPEKYEKHESVDPLFYWRKIYEMKPKVWLFPLKNEFFNHCKSNISWIEAIHAGAICVAPDLPEWRHAGVISYLPDDPNSFQNAAESAMALSAEEHQKCVQDGREEIHSKYDISVVNGYRKQIFESIFHPSFEKNPKDPFNSFFGAWAVSYLKEDEMSPKKK